MITWLRRLFVAVTCTAAVAYALYGDIPTALALLTLAWEGNANFRSDHESRLLSRVSAAKREEPPKAA